MKLLVFMIMIIKDIFLLKFMNKIMRRKLLILVFLEDMMMDIFFTLNGIMMMKRLKNQ